MKSPPKVRNDTPSISASSTPSVWCKTCGYVLDHLPEPRCPECGREFNLADSSTYLRSARRVPRSARVALIGLWLVLALVVGELAFAKYGGTKSKADLSRPLAYATAVVAFPIGTIFPLTYLSDYLLESFGDVLMVPFMAAWYGGFFFVLWRAKRRWFLVIPVLMLVIAFLGDLLVVYYG